ncbi:MAG: sodium:proton antiporter [Thermoprotei archaeon]|nr:MAG: sodium:proton antiporter [Thermoprotei archaeon]
MNRRNTLSGSIVFVLSIVLFIMLSYIAITGGIGKHPSEKINCLGQFFVNNSYNIFNKTFWAGSPEAVTSILWDYRGFDTIFETTVLFISIAGALVLAYKKINWDKLITPLFDKGLTLIVKTSVKIISAIVILLSLNLALRGYISPGGGFAGGSAYSIAPLLLISGLSIYYIIRLGYKLHKMINIRTIGLLGLSIVSLTPLLWFGYILQNQPKPSTTFPGYPVYIGPLYLGGSLIYLNISEFLVVSTEFIIIFLAMFLLLKSTKGEAE